MESNLEDVTGQDVQSFGLNAEVSSHPLSRETTNPVASFLAGLCGGSDSSELGEGQQALNLSPELIAQITAALSGGLVSTNTTATQTDHPPEELPIPETSVSPSTEPSLSLPATLPNITGDLSHVLQQDVEGWGTRGVHILLLPHQNSTPSLITLRIWGLTSHHESRQKRKKTLQYIKNK